VTVIDRIATQRHTDAMVALDTFDLITARIRKLLSWNRRISMTQRYTYIDRPPELEVGLTLDAEGSNGGITVGGGTAGRFFGVALRPGITTGFGFGAYASDGNGTEAEVWKRYHAAKGIAGSPFDRRRDMTLVTLNGGLDGDEGPARDDLIVVRAWNRDGVCDEKVIGFDTDAYWAEQEARPAVAAADRATAVARRLLHMEREHAGSGRDGHLNEYDLLPLFDALAVEPEVSR
jgi:hypothetical protein